MRQLFFTIELNPMIGNIVGRSLSVLFTISRNGKIYMRNIETNKYTKWGAIPAQEFENINNFYSAINISQTLPSIPVTPHIYDLPNGNQLGGNYYLDLFG